MTLLSPQPLPTTLGEVPLAEVEVVLGAPPELVDRLAPPVALAARPRPCRPVHVSVDATGRRLLVAGLLGAGEALQSVVVEASTDAVVVVPMVGDYESPEARRFPQLARLRWGRALWVADVRLDATLGGRAVLCPEI